MPPSSSPTSPTTTPQPLYTIHPLPRSDPIILPTILALFDESVAWLTARGISAQWGSEPLKDNRAHVEKVRRIVEDCEFLAAIPTSPSLSPATSSSPSPSPNQPPPTPLGLLAYSPNRMHPDIIPPAPQPELYIQLLITSRRDRRAKGVGRALMAECERVAVERGVGLLRVDCFDGEDAKGGLVAVYEGMGFEKMGERVVYDEKGWVGQVLGKWVGGGGGG